MARYVSIINRMRDLAALPFRAGALSRDRVLGVLSTPTRGAAAAERLRQVATWLASGVPAETFAATEQRKFKGDSQQRDSAELTHLLNEARACDAIRPAPPDWPRPARGVPQFATPKAGTPGKFRLISDLRFLNSFLAPPGFTLAGVRGLPMVARRYGAKIDLRSAFWQLILSGELAQMTMFEWEGVWWYWRVLPFGLTISPYVFQTFAQAWVDRWRALGIPCAAYLDDIIVFGATLEEHCHNIERVVNDLLDAGVSLSPDKVFVLPYTTLPYLGILVHLDLGCLSIPHDKIQRVVTAATALRDQCAFTGILDTKALERFLGLVAFCSIVYAPSLIFRGALDQALSSGRRGVRANASADGSTCSDRTERERLSGLTKSEKHE